MDECLFGLTRRERATLHPVEVGPDTDPIAASLQNEVGYIAVTAPIRRNEAPQFDEFTTID